MSDDMKPTNRPPQTTPDDYPVKLKKFRQGRATSSPRNLGPETNFEQRYFPRVAGNWVRNADDPLDGYRTALEAVMAARRYREACREAPL